jgi:hypothetical protein
MATRNRLDRLRLTRREAIHLLGVAGGLSILGSRELLSGEASAGDAAQAAAAVFPKGEVVNNDVAAH